MGLWLGFVVACVLSLVISLVLGVGMWLPWVWGWCICLCRVLGDCDLVVLVFNVVI